MTTSSERYEEDRRCAVILGACCEDILSGRTNEAVLHGKIVMLMCTGLWTSRVTEKITFIACTLAGRSVEAPPENTNREAENDDPEADYV